jgi:hypothetical protein
MPIPTSVFGLQEKPGAIIPGKESLGHITGGHFLIFSERASLKEPEGAAGC